jgi:putative heme iron utilization protein
MNHPSSTEPSQAELCKSLLIRGRHAILATSSLEAPGYPFGSLVQYALTDSHEPMLLVSRLAEHTRNFLADPKVSLCVSETIVEPQGDLLASPRLTYLGTIEEVDKEAYSRPFLERHPEAATYVTFKDFLIVKIVPHSLRYVGGFGVMSWVSESEYRQAPADPVAAFADSARTHMNEDHKEAMEAIVAAHLATKPESARMLAVDRLGFTLLYRSEHDEKSLRIGFARPVTTADEVRVEMVRITREARQKEASR